MFGVFVLFLIIGCGDAHQPSEKTVHLKIKANKTSVADTVEKPMIQFSDQQLEAFLDSIGKLPTQPLADQVSFSADSEFKKFTQPVSREVSAIDIVALKQAGRLGSVDLQLARRIFGELEVDSTCNAAGLLDSVKKGSVYLHYFKFGINKNGEDEFAVRVGDPEHCQGSEIYYFSGNKVIAKQNGYSRYFDDDVKYFTAADGEAIVYRLYEFDHGSGIWWLNYFFYKYEDGKLIPVLNLLQNGNMQAFWGPRVLWLESTVQKNHAAHHKNGIQSAVLYNK